MINVPFAGHTNPTLPITKKLVQRGHDVYYINAEEFRSQIENTGAKFVPYINYPQAPTMQQRKIKCFRAAFDTAMQLKEKFDILIYEMFFYPGIKIAQNLGIPCVRQFSQPAWNNDTISTASGFFRLSSRLIDIQVMGRKNAEYMKLSNRTLTQAVTNDSPNLNIVYVPEVFQEKRDSFPDNYLFMVPIQETVMTTKETIPFQEMKSPIVYISLGSIISNRGFCKKCIRAFGSKPISVILNTGKVPLKSLGKIPNNIYAYSYVPQVEVLQHADVFLTHCGMNSVNEAISNGVPMVAMPFINDQILNAQRITQLEIGKRVPSFLCRGEKVYKAVQEVIHNNVYRENVRQLQLLARNEMDINQVVKRIEAIIVDTYY